MRLFIFILLLQIGTLQAQEKFPNAPLKTISGVTLESKQLLNSKTPLVISFWATWCKPCLQELDAFNDMTAIWTKETGARIIAVSIDDSRTAAAIKKTAGLHDWSFDIFWDENQELKRALNISLIPHTIIVDRNGNIVKRYTAYIPGNEEKILDFVKTL
jgi:cytochrome c biogenesis protein CcmG/thiol:disulfide interchange protein DsbE